MNLLEVGQSLQEFNKSINCTITDFIAKFTSINLSKSFKRPWIFTLLFWTWNSSSVSDFLYSHQENSARHQLSGNVYSNRWYLIPTDILLCQVDLQSIKLRGWLNDFSKHFEVFIRDFLHFWKLGFVVIFLVHIRSKPQSIGIEPLCCWICF